MSRPEISVIVAAYNAMPYIRQCVDSVVGQSMSPDRYEVIVVDDGSTDGTAQYLDERAKDVRVVHQENSGGPASPRNHGLELAHGEYIFFLDADDYLGEEALERMLAMARANDSDIVLGKMRGVGGRVVPKSMFRRDQPRTSVFDSRVYWALNPLKLFRRNLIDRLDLRFDENLPVGQDQPFVAEAYLNADVISVLASYDCYYARLRDDGGNNTQRADGAGRRLPMLRAMFSLIPESVPPGEERDLLLRRHFQSEQREFLEHLGRESDVEHQREVFEEFARLVRAWCGPSVYEPLPAADRLRLELIRRGDLEAAVEMMRFQLEDRPYEVHTRGGRAYAAYPGHDDIDDAFFDVTDQLAVSHSISEARWVDDRFRFTGSIGIDRLTDHNATARNGTDQSGAQAVLVNRDGTIEHALPTTTTPQTKLLKFSVELDPRDVDGLIEVGQWDVFLDVTSRGVTRRARVGCHRDPSVTLVDSGRLVQARDGNTVRHVEAYFTKPFGNLSFDVGMNRGRVSLDLPMTARRQGGAIQLSGVMPGIGLTPDAIQLAAHRGGSVVALPTVCSPAGEFRARPAAVPPGRWPVSVSVPGCARPPVLSPVFTTDRPRSASLRGLSIRGLSPRRVRLTMRSAELTVDVAVITPGRIVRLLRRRLGLSGG